MNWLNLIPSACLPYLIRVVYMEDWDSDHQHSCPLLTQGERKYGSLYVFNTDSVVPFLSVRDCLEDQRK